MRFVRMDTVNLTAKFSQNSNQSLLGLPQEWVKVRTSNFVRSHGIDRNKRPLKMSGKLAVGVAMQGLPKKFQNTHIGYRAHRAVIFAIARLSCINNL